MPSYEYEFYSCPNCKTRLTTKKCPACGGKTKGQGKVSARYRLMETDGEKQKRTGWYSTKKEAEKEYLTVKSTAPKVDYRLRNGESYLFEDLLEQHLIVNSLETREGTQYDKRNLINKYILPHFKGKNIYQIDKIKLQDWQTWLFSQTYKRGKMTEEKKISNRHGKRVRGILNTFLEWVQDRYDIPNRLRGIKAPKNTELITKKDILELRELEKLNEVSRDDFLWNTMFNFMFLTGLRPGETLAFAERNFKTKEITVNKTLSRSKTGKMQVGDRKNNKEYTIPISTELTSIIEKYVQWKRENDIPKNFLFGGENFISKNILDRNLAKYMEKTDIEKHITPHCFRHSFVSMLIDIGYNSKMVAEMIDDTEEMVIKTYGHLYAAKKHEIISGVNEHLRKNLGTSLGTKLYQMAIIDVETR